MSDAPEPIERTPQWWALANQQAQLADVHLRELFAADPTRGERLNLEVGDLYVDYAKHRLDDETLVAAVRPGPHGAGRRAARRHVRRREDQRHRGPGRAPRGPAGAARRGRSTSTASTSCPRSTRSSTAWPTSPTGSARARGSATPAGASATWSTSASAAPTSGPTWPTRRCCPTPTPTSPCASSPTSTAPSSTS